VALLFGENGTEGFKIPYCNVAQLLRAGNGTDGIKIQ